MELAQVSAKDAMALRNRTGLGIMDCKQALAEANGDMKKAEEILSEKLKGKMDTRTDRAAGEGRVAACIDGSRASIVEIRAETDFTSRNDEFKAMADAVATCAATWSAMPVMSWLRSRCTPVMALRTCSAWPIRLSRCAERSSSRLRMRTSLS